jgi:hypothetical protein
MLAGLGAVVTPIEAPFEPERGAYQHGHATEATVGRVPSAATAAGPPLLAKGGDPVTPERVGGHGSSAPSARRGKVAVARGNLAQHGLAKLRRQPARHRLVARPPHPGLLPPRGEKERAAASGWIPPLPRAPSRRVLLPQAPNRSTVNSPHRPSIAS